MCSIFGYIARGKSTVACDTLAKIVRANVSRGPHSFGLAWIDAIGRLHCYKQVGRMTDHLPLLAMVRGAKMLIGHLRYATHGEPAHNINNHPHPCDGGWIVHNGVIRNYADLVHDRGLLTNSDCDSEILGLMIEHSANDSLLRRCSASIEATDGGLAMMGLWSRPDTLIVARRGNPLHQSDTPDGVYLATLAPGLPGKPVVLADDTVRRFTRKDGAIRVRKIAIDTQDQVAGALFDEDGTYRGG